MSYRKKPSNEKLDELKFLYKEIVVNSGNISEGISTPQSITPIPWKISDFMLLNDLEVQILII